MASADGWTTFPAERQGAVIEMRAGQRGGPLPFEASFDSGERIINTKGTAKRWIRRTRDINSGVFCNRVYVILKSRKLFPDKENQEGGANNLIFDFRGNQTDAPDERGRRNERATHARINVAAHRRLRTKHHPIRVLRLRAASLSEGGHLDKGVRSVERAASDRADDSVLRREQTRHQPIRVFRLRVASLSEGVHLDKGIRRVERASSGRTNGTVERVEQAVSDKTNDTVWRREQRRHHPIRVFRPRVASLSEGVRTQQTEKMAANCGGRTSNVEGGQLMEGFVETRTHGSIQSPGSDGVSSLRQMKYFQMATTNMKSVTMNLRVHVPEQRIDISVFHGADVATARRAMADEINDRLGSLLQDKVLPQMIRRGTLLAHPSVYIFLADATVDISAIKGNANFQEAMKGLTASGGSLRTLTEDMLRTWKSLAVTAGAGAALAPHMTFTLEPKPNVHLENMAHNADRTPQQLWQEVIELYRSAEVGSPLKESTLEALSGRLAIFSSYVAGTAGATTTVLCLEPQLLTSLIQGIGTLGLMKGSWTSQTVAVPIRVIGGGAAAASPEQDGRMSQDGLPPPFTAEERGFGGLDKCWRYPVFSRHEECKPGYSLSFLWCGRNFLDVWTTLALLLAEHCLTLGDLLPAALSTTDAWMERVYVAGNRNGDITRVMIASTPGKVTMAAFDALQDQELACTSNGDRVRLVFAPGRCPACRAEKCYKCGANNHGPGECPNNGRPYSQKTIPCTICRRPTGAQHSHIMDTCDAHLQVNDPARQNGCPICTHKGHSATQCPVWRDADGEFHVPTLLGEVLKRFPEWQVVVPNATRISGGRTAWFNTCPIPVSPIPVRMTYADSMRTPMSSPGASTSDSEQSRLERWTGGGGGNEAMMEFAKSLSAKMDAVGAAVGELRREQALQIAGMELLQSASEAQTKAIVTLQAAESRHAAFYAKIQSAHSRALALNASEPPDDMEDDASDTTTPGKDLMTAPRQ